MENIFPKEIITEVISRLPVESVLVCRRVCKTWKTLTYGPSFALMHLRHSLMTQHHLQDDDGDDQKYQNHYCSASSSSSKVGFVCPVDRHPYGGPKQLYYGEYDDQEESSSYKTLKRIKHPPLNRSSRLVDSCNGLICFTVYHHLINDPIYICNPITRECIYLPRFTKKGLKGGAMSSGFGYIPRTNEYKVVRIYYEKGDREELAVGQVQVYTLGSGNGWRNKGEIKFSLGGCMGILANGALHWGVSYGKIVSFDLADEEFHFLPSPPACSNSFHYLSVLGGLLCVATQEGNECGKVWSLRKMEEESNGSSNDRLKELDYNRSWRWSLEFTIKLEGLSNPDCFLSGYKLFALTKGGEALLLWRYDTAFICYNLKTASFEQLVDYKNVFNSFRLSIGATPHMNSFISLQDLGEEDVNVVGSKEVLVDQAPSGDLFRDYFRKADLDNDGLISPTEEAIFFPGFDLPPRVLGQIFRAVDANSTYNLGEEEFYNALKLVSVVQSGKELTPDVVSETLHGPDSDKIPAPKIVNPAAAAAAANTIPRRCYKAMCGHCRICSPGKFGL